MCRIGRERAYCRNDDRDDGGRLVARVADKHVASVGAGKDHPTGAPRVCSPRAHSARLVGDDQLRGQELKPLMLSPRRPDGQLHSSLSAEEAGVVFKRRALEDGESRASRAERGAQHELARLPVPYA
eukprot:scaffold24337_cov26-Tisochrysis_lutea.AAC.4